MDKQGKEAVVEGLKAKLAKANAAFLAEYRGMDVETLGKLRSDVRKGNGEVQVIKNRLAKISAKGTPFEELSKAFTGPLLLAMAYDDPVEVAKAVKDNMVKTSPLDLKSGALEGKTLTVAEVKHLADLPDKHTLLTQILFAVRGPLQNFANVITAVPQDFVNVLNSVKRQKEAE